MIQLQNIDLSEKAVTQLEKYHEKVNEKLTFEAKVLEAKKVWDGASKKNQTFKEIKKKLNQMCSGSQRCCYCEDAPADEIEHIAPKNIYPLLCFSWSNYLYACGPCNGPKNNQFAVFLDSNGSFQDITPPKGTYPIPPNGTKVLIDPRVENPMDFMILDINGGTFRFAPISEDTNSQEYKKAEYTIKVLRLNEREYLIESRETAFGSYRARLIEYTKSKKEGAKKGQLQKMITGIKSERHITVFKEMQRQYRDYELFADLFDSIPEALTW